MFVAGWRPALRTEWLIIIIKAAYASTLLLLLLCKHTAARIRIWWGCPAGGRFPPGECFLALSFALSHVASSLQSRQRPQPGPRTLDEYTPRQYWLADFILRLVSKCEIGLSSRSLHLLPSLQIRGTRRPHRCDHRWQVVDAMSPWQVRFEGHFSICLIVFIQPCSDRDREK